MTEFILRQNNSEKTVQARRQGSEIHVQLAGGNAGAEPAEAAVFHLIAHTNDTILLERILPDGSRQQWRLVGHKDGTKRQLWVNGRTHHYERVLPRGGGSASSDASLAATIPAVVADILVSVGDQVQDGDKLILLESMKMIIPIQAPTSGTVTALHCAKGDSVQAGVPLLELDQL
ncbi:MAG: acetyl-CoA carboxylase biotin carboxyl carrier protein subunit [Ardenticatenaceae bacterium]|nr:acetyl-CoA carboxylase biotin carboxyl carrier protein subunit [Ardenticatenaceae bacterium]